jgi:hypothetical protein
MVKREIELDGKIFLCAAKAIDWVHGLGVAIELFDNSVLVATLCVFCDRTKECFLNLSKLSEDKLAQERLERFISEHLAVNYTSLVKWQRELESLGYKETSPLFTSF